MSDILVLMESTCDTDGCARPTYARNRCRACYDKARSEGMPTTSRRGRERPTHCVKGHEYTEANTYVVRRSNGREAWSCRECRRSAMRAWNQTSKGRTNVQRRRAARYGLTLDQLRAIEARGTCGICGDTEEQSGAKLHIDHCHTSSGVRGLLCTRCNTALGLFRDNPDLMAKAIKYLEAVA